MNLTIWCIFLVRILVLQSKGKSCSLPFLWNGGFRNTEFCWVIFPHGVSFRALTRLIDRKGIWLVKTCSSDLCTLSFWEPGPACNDCRKWAKRLRESRSILTMGYINMDCGYCSLICDVIAESLLMPILPWMSAVLYTAPLIYIFSTRSKPPLLQGRFCLWSIIKHGTSSNK